MSAGTIETAAPVDRYTNGFPSDFFNAWEAEKRERAEVRKAKRPVMLECLDPEKAKDYEDKKPKFAFDVECTYKLPGDDGRLEEKHNRMTLSAHNESEAWAMFCDRIKHWPSPNAVDRTITKLKAK